VTGGGSPYIIIQHRLLPTTSVLATRVNGSRFRRHCRSVQTVSL